MRRFSWSAVTRIFRADLGFPRSAETIHRRWLYRQSYLLALGSVLVTLLAFPLYHLLTTRTPEHAFFGQYHRIAALFMSAVCALFLLFHRGARAKADYFSLLNIVTLLISLAIDIALSDKPRRYTAAALVPLFGSTYIFTKIPFMTWGYIFAGTFFAVLNTVMARPFDIIAIHGVAYFAAWWMALIRIRSLQRISYDQARLYERRVYDQRVRLARNLHDSLGGDLMQLSLQIGEGAPREQVLDLAQSVIAKTKNLVYTLEPSNENQPFPECVASYAERLKNIGRFSVSTEIDSDWPRLPMDRNLNLQAIFTEWMTNALRHSAATSLKIFLKYRKPYYFLLVRDNGIGFRWNGNKKGSGLRNIALRAGLLNAKVFARKTGKGALFYLKGGVE